MYDQQIKFKQVEKEDFEKTKTYSEVSWRIISNLVNSWHTEHDLDRKIWLKYARNKILTYLSITNTMIDSEIEKKKKNAVYTTTVQLMRDLSEEDRMVTMVKCLLGDNSIKDNTSNFLISLEAYCYIKGYTL